MLIWCSRWTATQSVLSCYLLIIGGRLTFSECISSRWTKTAPTNSILRVMHTFLTILCVRKKHQYCITTLIWRTLLPFFFFFCLLWNLIWILYIFLHQHALKYNTHSTFIGVYGPVQEVAYSHTTYKLPGFTTTPARLYAYPPKNKVKLRVFKEVLKWNCAFKLRRDA